MDWKSKRIRTILEAALAEDKVANDITTMLTHRFGLHEWWPALKAIARQDQSGALKVAFTPNGT